MFLRRKTDPGRTCINPRSTALNGWTDLRTVVAESTLYETTLPVNRIANPSVFFRVKRL